ncbi:hemolysin family protein [Hamadaea tsunoensis]|uniref:hemolysin family protein n=1 Tax=Hamadaea tsunoensis TaxID=53368 RepID=UPI000407348B|nr:hemolysin family protein [Hamadaea tsunoensis]
MGGYGLQLILVFFLILVNAAFSGSEMALVSLRDSQIQRLESNSRGGRVLAKLARDPNRFLATIQIGITTAGFLASAAAAVSLAEPLVKAFAFLGSAADAAAIVVVTLVLTFVTLVFGELAPKRIAMQRAEGWALFVARPLDWLSSATRPAVWLLGRCSDIVVGLFGVDPAAGREEISVEEIRDLVVAQRHFSPEQRTIIAGAFDIADRTLREIIVPRREVTYLRADLPVAEALGRLADSGHSRAPVCGPEGLDDVVGVVHLRDLLGGDPTQAVRDRAREPLFVPETLTVSHAMRQMRTERQQLALIVDERGAIDGIVTMEDLVEEVVGEIYDETDPDIESAITEPDGAYLVPGSFPLHDLPDLGIDSARFEDADYTTVAGLVLAHLGQIPKQSGDIVSLPGLTCEVMAIRGRAITQVRLRRTKSR